ncbi:MAG TPA: hypothetical protein VD886_08865 [Herpetosiphonaceae bacterium]|nr:hypothetical protein [Herpetosiphonaceae bacterium]
MAKQPENEEFLPDQDLEFQRRSWVVQRIAWGIMAAVAVAGLAGVFGSGPVSQARAGAGGLSVEYQSFARFQAATTLRVHLDAAAIQDGTAAIRIDQAYLERFEIVDIIPEPAASSIDGAAVVYSFTIGGSGDVVFNLKPERIGGAVAAIGAASGETVRVEQFVYP